MTFFLECYFIYSFIYLTELVFIAVRGLSLVPVSRGHSSLFAKRVVSSAYLRLLMFLPAILILACASSSLEFLMRYSAAATVAAAAKSLQSCPTLCDPIDGSPPGSTIPGTLQARTLEWVAISFSNA